MVVARAALLLLFPCAVLTAQSRQFESVPLRQPEVWPAHDAIVVDSDGDGEVEIYGATTAGVVGRRSGLPQELVHRVPSTVSRSVVVVDIDGDGGTDLLLRPDINSPVGAALVLLLGVPTSGGLMSFQEVPLPAVSNDVRGVSASDFDGDGDLDLVIGTTARLGGGGLHYLQQGPGGFVAAPLPSAQGAGFWPVSGDFDGDGDLDVFATNRFGAAVWLQGNRFGGFVDSSSFLPPTGIVTAPVAADLDGDGFDDIAMLLPGGAVSVLWGRPGGMTVGAPVAIAPATRMCAGDMDGDGKSDLLLASELQVVQLMSRSARSFSARAPVTIARGIRAVSIVEYYGSGFRDVMVATHAATLRVLAGAGSQLVVDVGIDRGLRQIGLRPSLPAAADVDGDGRVDIVFESQAGIELHRGDGFGSFAASATPQSSVSTDTNAVHLPDLDGDGDPDLLRVVEGRIEAHLNDGGGVFTLAASHAFPGSSSFLKLTDLDGDQVADILMIDPLGVQVLRLSGSAFQSQLVTISGADLLSWIEVADLDGDGDIDALYGTTTQTIPTVLQNDGAGRLAVSAGWSIATPTPLRSCVALDFDLDGDLDLCGLGSNTRPLYFLRNDGARTFVDVSATALPVVVPGFFGIIAGDYDQDGDPDLLGLQGNQVAFLQNRGGQFTDASVARIGNSISGGFRVNTGDFDGDGDVDIGMLQLGTNLVVGVNHVRQLRADTATRIGLRQTIDLYSGPSFGPPGFSLLAFALGGATTPQRLPGIAGLWLLDTSQAVIVDVRTMSQIGRSQVFLNVPNQQSLVGTELFVQSLIASAGAQPFGLTNALQQVIRP